VPVFGAPTMKKLGSDGPRVPDVMSGWTGARRDSSQRYFHKELALSQLLIEIETSILDVCQEL
jgi:hypothetical protein